MRTESEVAAMQCPVCRVPLAMSDRQGIEIDYCPQCRGVWLDRGELDKIVERSAPRRAIRSTAARPIRATATATASRTSARRASSRKSSTEAFYFPTNRNAQAAMMQTKAPAWRQVSASPSTSTMKAPNTVSAIASCAILSWPGVHPAR